MNDNSTLQSSGCLFFIPRSGFPFTGQLNVNGTLLCQDVSFWNLWTLAPLIYILRVGFSPNVLFTVFKGCHHPGAYYIYRAHFTLLKCKVNVQSTNASET